MAKTNGKMIANNKKAYHDYFILENYEAGIALHGTEVKSLRMGKCSIKEAFIRVENGEVYIYGMHISPYEKGNIFNKDPLRVRKLLLHKSEINKLLGKTKEKGIAIVPLKVYFKGSLVKVEIGLAKGKNKSANLDNLNIKIKKYSKGKRRETSRSGIWVRRKKMVPRSKEELRNMVSQTTIETYEELTPQLIQLIDQTKHDESLTEAQKQDEISLHMMGYIKSCTNEIIIEVLAEILGLEDSQ